MVNPQLWRKHGHRYCNQVAAMHASFLYCVDNTDKHKECAVIEAWNILESVMHWCWSIPSLEDINQK